MYDQQNNDYELLYMIYQRDDESLRLLIRKYERVMYLFFHSHVSLMYQIRGYADEYQIGRIVILKAIETYRYDKEASFRHYYLFLLRNEMCNIVRKNQVYFQRNLLSSEYLIGECPMDYLEEMWEDPRADMQADWRVRCADVRSRILDVEKGLSEVERRILRLRLYGYTYAEIAQVLHITIKKVDNTLCKVRSRKV